MKLLRGNFSKRWGMFNFWPDVTRHSASAFFPFLFYELHNKMQHWSAIFSQYLLLPWLTDQRFPRAFSFALEVLGDSQFLSPICKTIHSAFCYQTSLEKTQDLHSDISRISNPLKKKIILICITYFYYSPILIICCICTSFCTNFVLSLFALFDQS